MWPNFSIVFFLESFPNYEHIYVDFFVVVKNYDMKIRHRKKSSNELCLKTLKHYFV